MLEDLFEYFVRAEERGSWRSIEFWLASDTFARVKRSGDASTLQRIAVWEAKLARVKEHEAAHGAGSLYVKDHPANIEMEAKRQRLLDCFESALGFEISPECRRASG
jgi:hypothetical protein